MKFVSGFPDFLAAEHLAMVGELLEIASVKKKFLIGFCSGSPVALEPLF